MRSQFGFTLIELMVSVAIVAIIASIGLVNYRNAQISSRDSRRKIDLRSLQPPLDLYLQRNGFYPATLNLLVPDYISRLPIDPSSGGNYSYIRISQTSYVTCTNLENGNDPDINDDPNCSGSNRFSVSYP